jgi:uncharacterized protein (TIGR00255 family)
MMYSMTGFAAAKGSGAGFSWVWDLRSVNGKGLDLRIRVPDWVEGLEFALRAELAKRLQRGNINLTLKITRRWRGRPRRLSHQRRVSFPSFDCAVCG